MNSFIRATRRGGGTSPSDEMIRSDACTTDMIKAAATPLPEHVGQCDADPAVTQLDEIVVVATDAAGRNADRGEIGTFGARRASGSRRRWTSDARAMSRRSVSCSTTRSVSRAFSIISAN
jgi:hypothetical protein